MIRRIFVFQVLESRFILEIDVGEASRVVLLDRVIRTVANCTCRESLEFHNILCECPCLIRENKMYHSKLFIKVGTLTSCVHSNVRTNHSPVSIDEPTL
jgi:hypothetical protein